MKPATTALAQPNRGPLPGELDLALTSSDAALILCAVIVAVLCLLVLRARRGGQS